MNGKMALMLIGGLILGGNALQALFTGKIYRRYLKVCYKKDNPKTFYFSVIMQAIASIVFFVLSASLG